MSNRPIVFVAVPELPVVKRLIVDVAPMFVLIKTERPAALGPPAMAFGVQFVLRLQSFGESVWFQTKSAAEAEELNEAAASTAKATLDWEALRNEARRVVNLMGFEFS